MVHFVKSISFISLFSRTTVQKDEEKKKALQIKKTIF